MPEELRARRRAAPQRHGEAGQARPPPTVLGRRPHDRRLTASAAPRGTMTDLLLIRHGLPVSGIAGPGLSPEGIEQARRLGTWLKGEDVDVLVTSPMRRAQETAATIADEMGRQ